MTHSMTIIAPDTHISGNVEGSQDVTVHGHVDGNIRLTHALTVAEDGQVHGEIGARHVIIAGLVSGTVRASERIVMLNTARVNARIEAPALQMIDGALFTGELQIGVGMGVETDPVRSAAIAAQTSVSRPATAPAPVTPATPATSAASAFAPRSTAPTPAIPAAPTPAPLAPAPAPLAATASSVFGSRATPPAATTAAAPPASLSAIPAAPAAPVPMSPAAAWSAAIGATPVAVDPVAPIAPPSPVTLAALFSQPPSSSVQEPTVSSVMVSELFSRVQEMQAAMQAEARASQPARQGDEIILRELRQELQRHDEALQSGRAEMIERLTQPGADPKLPKP